MLNMKKMIRAEIKKIKNLQNSFAPDSQKNGQRDRERRKFGKILFEKDFLNILLFNSL